MPQTGSRTVTTTIPQYVLDLVDEKVSKSPAEPNDKGRRGRSDWFRRLIYAELGLPPEPEEGPEAPSKPRELSLDGFRPKKSRFQSVEQQRALFLRLQGATRGKIADFLAKLEPKAGWTERRVRRLLEPIE